MRALKLMVIGPAGSGKTTISNFLASASDSPYEYHATQGVRILEFEVQEINVNNKLVSKDIELWDCSGNTQTFQHCWPAMRQDVVGVIFVCSTKSSGNYKQLQDMYDYFVTQSKIGADSCVLFFYDPEKTMPEVPKFVLSVFAKVSQVKCTLQDDGNKLKTDFRSFLSTLVTKMQENAEQEEKNIISENVLLLK